MAPIPNSCGVNPCANGATCVVVANGGYQCICRTGFTGLRCELSATSNDDRSPNRIVDNLFFLQLQSIRMRVRRIDAAMVEHVKPLPAAVFDASARQVTLALSAKPLPVGDGFDTLQKINFLSD